MTATVITLAPAFPAEMAPDEGACYMPTVVYNNSIILTHWGRLGLDHASGSAYEQVRPWPVQDCLYGKHSVQGRNGDSAVAASGTFARGQRFVVAGVVV